MKKIEKFANQFLQEIQKQNRESLTNNNCVQMRNSDCTHAEDKSMLLEDKLETNGNFLEQKNIEAFKNNQAFARLITRVDLLEKQLIEQGDEIEEMREQIRKVNKTLKKIKKTLDSLKIFLHEIKDRIRSLEGSVSVLKNKVSDLRISVRNILRLAGEDMYVKKNEIRAVSEKMVRRDKRRQEKNRVLIDKEKIS